MNLKALSFGAVLGFLVAVIPSCGSPTCGPANCNGCCDSTNKCVPNSASNSNTACGKGGTTCANCTTLSQVCNATSFVCETMTGQGGGTGTGGGATGGSGGGATGGGGGATDCTVVCNRVTALCSPTIVTFQECLTDCQRVPALLQTLDACSQLSTCNTILSCMAAASDGGIGGGAGGGGGTVTGCNIGAQNCPNAESCIYTDQMGSTACFPGACDIVAQNCPTATDKCSYAALADAGVGRACGPAGTLTEGQGCVQATDQCGKGLVCINGPGGGFACAKYCYTTTNCTTATNGQCVGVVTIGGTAERPATCVNIASCDPLLQNCAVTTDACSLTQTGPGCIPGGNTAIGADCTMSNCVKGSICLGTPTAASCHAFCNRDGGMPSCATGTCGGVSNQMGVMQVFGACQ